MILRVTQYGEPILRKVGRPITEFNASLADLVHNMFETMDEQQGIGLAAQQIDKALQVCVLDLRPSEGSEVSFNYSYDHKEVPLNLIMPMALVNPELTIIDASADIFEEGCLSFPEVTGRVRRPIGVRCRFRDIEGSLHVIEADGLFSRCILHEIDHLNGKLFIDRMNPKDLKRNESRINKIYQNSRNFLKKRIRL